jgi:hypothetical protein
MRERLVRLLIIGAAALLVLVLARSLTGRGEEVKVNNSPVSLPEIPIKEKLEKLGGTILGKTVDLLPGTPTLEEGEEESEEAEPIEEPVKNIQLQTDSLIEAIKELPQDQLEAIKEQICKEVCEEILMEE